MNRNQVAVLVCFVAAFAAGVAVGALFTQRRKPPAHGSWLTTELKLNKEQREQMRTVWSDVMESMGQEHGAQRAQLQAKRDEAIRALFDEEQLKRYEDILRQHREGLNRLSQERRALFEQADERTKEILTPKQRARYEELLKKRGGPGRRGPRPQTPPPPAGEWEEQRPGERPGPPPGPMSGGE